MSTKNKKLKAQNLKQLIKEWDKKLKSEGFQDIENRTTGHLSKTGGDRVWDPKDFDHRPPTYDGGYSSITWKESQAEYYRLAGQMHYEKDFKDVRMRLIWQLHSEGLSTSEICEALNTSYDKVRRAVERMAKEFCLK